MNLSVSGTPAPSARQSSKLNSPLKANTKDSARSVGTNNNDWNVFINSANNYHLNLDSGRSEKHTQGKTTNRVDKRINNSGLNTHTSAILNQNIKSVAPNTPSRSSSKVDNVGDVDRRPQTRVRRFNSQGSLLQSARTETFPVNNVQINDTNLNNQFRKSNSGSWRLNNETDDHLHDQCGKSNSEEEKEEEPVRLGSSDYAQNFNVDAVKTMLQKKYVEKINQRKIEQNESQSVEAMRRKAREQKAKEARQEAIEELRKKREVLRTTEESENNAFSNLQENRKAEKKEIVKRAAKNQSLESHLVANDYQTKVTLEEMRTRNDASKPNYDKISNNDNSNNETSVLAATDTMSQVSKTTVTIDELFDTLKTLEKVEEFDKPLVQSSRQRGPLDWLDDLEATNAADIAKKKEASFRLHNNTEEIHGPVVQSLLSEQKIRSIMTYLDEVDTAERLSEMEIDLERSNQQLERPALLVPGSKEIEEFNEQAAATTAEITNTMLSQRLELEEKRRTVQMLQKALNQQRELTVRHAKETEKEMKKRLDVQKDEYEEAVKRHLSFIDQLIDDKKTLAEKYETVVKELKTAEKKFQDKLKSLQESHQVELEKVKDVHAAAEKLRREKWIEEKTKKIKEMTVKGLEPEIQRLIAQHKTELKKIKSVHEAELLHSDERAAQKYVKMTEELREQLHQEKEAACARERELARQTYEKQLQQEEEAYQQQRRRLHAEVQEEKERLAQQAARQRAELDRLQQKLEETQTNSVQTMRIEYEKARDEQDRRHAAEIRQLREQLALEKAAWEENMMKKQETVLTQREREMHKKVLQDRDKEIELVIERLEADNRASREESERVAENRIKRIREKYESEMAELERNEKQMMERYNQTKASLVEAEGENERLNVLLAQKEKDISELKKLLEKLNEERDRVADVVRQEFADRIVTTDEENKRVKNEMSELKARHRIELERAKLEVEAAKKAKDDEMEEVHKRIKQAILKKEEVVSQLKEQYEAALKRADHLEGLLEQQRKQLLGKK